MRKIYLSLGCAFLMQLTNNLSAQVLLNEDFSSATGTTPPAGWTNNEIAPGGGVWEFDNSGDRTLVLPISDPAAIFDSDHLGNDGIPEEATLESPSFDASQITDFIYLSFDQSFNQYSASECHVEVWDGSTWQEVYFNDMDLEADHQLIDISTAVNYATDAKVRFRYVGDWDFWWIIDNVNVQHGCHPVYILDAQNTTTTTTDLTWSLGDVETSWNIEWGPIGFAPGTGAEEGSDVSSTESYTINGLTPGTDYDIYVQADCGNGNGSVWMKVTIATLCAPITDLPWLETFDNMPSVDYGLFPNCWVDEGSDWLSDNSYNTGGTAYSGDNFLAIYYYGDDYIWTPEFQLTAGSNYEFSFMMAGDGYDGWDGEAYVSGSQSSADATPIGDPFITSSDVSDNQYEKKIFCFTPDTSGIYSFGLHVSSNFNPYLLTFDDFSLVERTGSAGTDGTMNVCQTSGLVDLNGIITKDDQTGIWSFDPNPNTIVNDSLFDPQYVPTGTVYVNYITSGCLVDTATAIIHIYGPSMAGDDGAITACKHEPLSLLSGLNGTFTTGGDWYDPTNTQLPSSQITTGNFIGSYNYNYITGNGVCPDDTSLVVVTVTNCDWLAVGENELEGINVYPNPSTGLVYIESTFSAGSYDLVITDVNGRVIDNKNNTIVSGTNAIHLENAQRGIYFFKLSNSTAEKVYRVIIE